MKQKKEAKSWYIGITYYLTAAFVPALLGAIFFAIVLGLLANILPENILKVIDSDYGSTILVTVFLSLIFWFGAIYSSRFINKRYIICSKREVILWGTVSYFLLNGGFSLLKISVEDIVQTLLLTGVFYYFANRYIVQDKNFIEQKEII